MKLELSLSYKSFPEFADLPRGKAERQFHFASKGFYSSLEGVKAGALVVACGALGVLLGFHFGPLASAIGAGAGIFAGSIAFNLLMKQSICAQLALDRAEREKKATLASQGVATAEAAPTATVVVSTSRARPARRPVTRTERGPAVAAEHSHTANRFKFKV